MTQMQIKKVHYIIAFLSFSDFNELSSILYTNSEKIVNWSQQVFQHNVVLTMATSLPMEKCRIATTGAITRTCPSGLHFGVHGEATG